MLFIGLFFPSHISVVFWYFLSIIFSNDTLYLFYGLFSPLFLTFFVFCSKFEAFLFKVSGFSRFFWSKFLMEFCIVFYLFGGCCLLVCFLLLTFLLCFDIFCLLSFWRIICFMVCFLHYFWHSSFSVPSFRLCCSKFQALLFKVSGFSRFFRSKFLMEFCVVFYLFGGCCLLVCFLQFLFSILFYIIRFLFKIFCLFKVFWCILLISFRVYWWLCHFFFFT